jgi:cellulose synthase (UDP-forming)
MPTSNLVGRPRRSFPRPTSLRPRRRASNLGAGAPHHSGQRSDRAVHLGRELALTRVSLAVTVLGLVLFGIGMVVTAAHAVGSGAVRQSVEGVIFAGVVSFMVYGNLVYQTTRLGYLLRRRDHRAAPRAELDELYRRPPRPLVALIPSYREEPGVVRQALLAAALQEYPDKRVVLLIDDPPAPSDGKARRQLSAARALPGEIKSLLCEPADRARSAVARFEASIESRSGPCWGRRRWIQAQRRELAGHHRHAAGWLEELAATEPMQDHNDALFLEQVLREAARSHRREADVMEHGHGVDEHRIRVGYRRLLARFDVGLSAFERKRYVNLSHEPNKAMNLNSFIGLLGASWRNVECPDGLHLEPAVEDEADLVVPQATYIVTLDADSVLVPAYALRLVHALEQPGNERVAVIQTPYSAIPGSAGALERMAGATTDMQYIVHQGFTHHRATFWVGANALIRRAALDDLIREEQERGFPIRRYIQDRTVIEDTESSVDLIERGWTLVNYPERLSYSATPPDFGALLIQRRRWANGGLIILPKLLRHLVRQRDREGPGGEGLMRVHYLTSISGANIGLLLLLSYPFSTPDAAAWLPVAALPYFFLYARDLHQAGYSYGDVVRVYALNLLLIPVNLAGVAKSIHQGVSGRKIPFGRTPKVQGRTRTPRAYLVAELVLVVYWSMGCLWDLLATRWGHAGFQAANVALLLYAITQYIGWHHFLADLRPARRLLSEEHELAIDARTDRVAA